MFSNQVFGNLYGIGGSTFAQVIGHHPGVQGVRLAFIAAQAAYPFLKQGGVGRVINNGSMLSIFGLPFHAAYGASKGGVVQLTKTAALEYAEKGIRLNAVCPGAIKTEMIDRITGLDAGAEKQFAALHPMNRMGTSAEIADAVVWLCSPQAAFVTGVALPVDGGLVAR